MKAINIAKTNLAEAGTLLSLPALREELAMMAALMTITAEEYSLAMERL